jgi:hypothetical protein
MHVAFTAAKEVFAAWHALLAINPLGHDPIGVPKLANKIRVMTALAPYTAQLKLIVTCSLTRPQITVRQERRKT